MCTTPRRIQVTALLLAALLAGPMAPMPVAAAGYTLLQDLLVSSFSWSESQMGARSFALGRDAAGRVILEDRAPSGVVRRTHIGFGAALASAQGSVLIGPDQVAWLPLAGDGIGIDFFRLGDVSVPGPLQAARVASVAVSRDFDPDSMQLGIIAILIGLVGERVPTLSFRDGSVHRVLIWNGSTLLPFLEQDLG